MNRLRSAGPVLEGVAWPEARLGEGLRAFARRVGFPGGAALNGAPPPDLRSDELSRWIAAVADAEGFQAAQVFPSFAEGAAIVAAGAPALVRMPDSATASWLIIIDGSARSVSVLRPDLQVVTLRMTQLEALFQDVLQRLPPDTPSTSQEESTLADEVRAAIRQAALEERARTARFGGVWLLQRPVPESLRAAAREAGVIRAGMTVAAAHLVQALLFVLSWWVLGRGVLEGRIDTGWLLAWLLLVASLVPFRLLTSWTQGLLVASAGATLRRRLLRGALAIDPQEIKSRGAGQLFGTIAESAAIESLALSGGIGALLASVELLVAVAVLAGAGWTLPLLLSGWLAGVGFLARRFLRHRKSWADVRLRLTDRLIEQMVGHRTWLGQLRPDHRCRDEDDLVEHYLESAIRMDRWELRLLALAPRGWILVALGALAPAAVLGAPAGRLAVAVGGVLLAYRALRRLTTGVADITGAVIAGGLLAPLARAAARREPPTLPAAAIPPRPSNPPSGLAAIARQVVFRYRPGAPPVLDNCDLRINRGTRLLVEGPSGSGKTTLASMLAGLVVPESGLLLIDGFDRGVLGRAGWRARVVMAPQPHDNYLLGGSLALNLLMGRHWPARPEDLSEAEEVCRELGLGDLIDRMPAGLHQTIGETGWQLSQGERTRIYLARALLQKPDLLILDESFSALDPENVDRAIRCVTQRAPTVLAIAHT